MVLYVTSRINSAVGDNPPYANGRQADIHITSHGSDFYYAVLAFTGFVGLLLLGGSMTRRRTDRLFFYLLAGANLVCAISYYAMGSNLGFTPVRVEFYRGGADRVRGQYREVFWTRYVDWFITTPLLLLSMLLTAGVPAPTLLFTIFMNEIMIICGLVGAVTTSTYKWGFFAFGCAAEIYVLQTLLWRGRKYAKHVGNDVHRVYTISVLWQVLLWICYPICWGASEGGNIIAPDSEAVFYGVLDMLAKPVYSLFFLFLHRRIAPHRLGLQIRDYDEDFYLHQGRHEDGRHLTNPEHKEETPASTGVRTANAGGEDGHHAHENGTDNTGTTTAVV